jgi:hypothetical protein
MVFQGSNPEDSWCPEGPILPIEFARHSSGNRLTLVLVPGRQVVKTLWNTFTVDDLLAARENGGGSEQITSGQGDDAQLDISADGKRIVFSSFRANVNIAQLERCSETCKGC